LPTQEWLDRAGQARSIDQQIAILWQGVVEKGLNRKGESSWQFSGTAGASDLRARLTGHLDQHVARTSVPITVTDRAVGSMLVGGEIGVSFYAPAGWAIDAKDMGVGLNDWRQGSYLAGGIGILGAGIGYLPWGDIIKVPARSFAGLFRRGADDVVELASERAAKVVTVGGNTGAFGARELGQAIARDPLASKAYSRIQQAGFGVHLVVGEAGDLAGETFNTGVLNIYLDNNASIREALATLVHESTHVDLLARTKRLYGSRGVGEYMARAREFLFVHGRRPTMVEREEIIQELLELGYEHR
jgi:hypothetical protein